ncbi:molecular chaperone Hsp20 [Paramagnetospirillum marisnigri]|uniref:Molecular chaperone Hsp20 n=1 Tax=Paramagnetospirillum marisnigri TaxID=1285242 RepID=A0A178MQ01_9PROT|nr:Hsp20/alpha crystallin family protein [Paramagnetospirillum marisnigri]OAN50681.1 molecular chaperone Hsp20 [Paramagnetospirillum marisnigri]
MDVKSLMPWNRSKNLAAERPMDDGSPFLALHREMNRLFDDFFHGADLPTSRFGWGGGWPKMEVEDKADGVKVSVELPGMEEKEVDVTLRDGVLTVRGEKKSEAGSPSHTERWYGQFQRSVQLGSDIDPDKVSASLKNGLLTVTVEKKPESDRTEKRIPIN